MTSSFCFSPPVYMCLAVQSYTVFVVVNIPRCSILNTPLSQYLLGSDVGPLMKLSPLHYHKQAIYPGLRPTKFFLACIGKMKLPRRFYLIYSWNLIVWMRQLDCLP